MQSLAEQRRHAKKLLQQGSANRQQVGTKGYGTCYVITQHCHDASMKGAPQVMTEEINKRLSLS